MVELVGGILVMLGGGLLSATGLVPATAVERGRRVLGDSDGAVTTKVPAAWNELVNQLD